MDVDPDDNGGWHEPKRLADEPWRATGAGDGFPAIAFPGRDQFYGTVG